jgi:hypothetical protein
VSGWYKRSTQKVLLGISLVLVIGLNINTITIADYLSRNEAVRSTVVMQVEKTTAGTTTAGGIDYATAKKQLNELGLPIGWSNGWGAPRTGSAREASGGYEIEFRGRTWLFRPWNDLFGPLVGWLLTAAAATLGAPFWFDLLNKIMVIRSTVKPHEKSEEEGSEDRQSRPRTPVVVQPTPAAPATQAGAAAAGLTNTASAATGSSPEDICGVGTSIPATPDDRLPPATGGVG